MGTSGPRCRIGVDIGGTFTDLVLVDDDGDLFRVEKVSTSADDPARGVLEGIDAVLAAAGVGPDAVRQVVHGTTLFTNALIERKGPRIALITTEGFRDALEIAREHRYDLYDLFLERPEPLVPRRRRREVPERMLEDGSVLEPLDREAAARLVDELAADDVRAVAVCFLHAYRNPAHERAMAEVVEQRAPEMTLSLSSEVAPEIREYERASTTVANVYVQDLAEGYLGRLEAGLRDRGVPGELFVMQSNGGLCTVGTATRFPIRLVESGPAAGALAAAHHGGIAGRDDLLSFDMGGTTAKACLIEDGKPLVSPAFEVARVYRFEKGSGLPVRVPVIEMIEIGAGGGSIARVDDLGRLTVGPESAGSDPGPACYGKGGRRPTVTDADLVLGYLDPEFFLGGRMRLDRGAALDSITREVASELGLDPVRAAWGIHRMVDENMASAARVHAIERGKNVRDFPLFAFGGAGPVHAERVARILGCSRVICPPAAGVISALGFLAAPLAFDFVRTMPGKLEDLDWSAVTSALADMAAEGRSILEPTVPVEDIGYRRWADMRYRGQGHEIRVRLPDQELGPGAESLLRQAFERRYLAIYGRTSPEVPVDVVSWRLVAEGPVPGLRLPGETRGGAPPTEGGTGAGADDGGGSPSSGNDEPPAGGASAGRHDGGGTLKGCRAAYLPEEDDLVETPVYDRYRMTPGDRIAGPAIVEERESTVVIGPGSRGRVDEHLHLVIELSPVTARGARVRDGTRRGEEP